MCLNLDCFLNFSGSETARTNLDGFLLSINQRLHFNEIRFPDPSGFIMSMAYIVSCYSPFSTYITLTSHCIPTFNMYTGLVT